MANTASLHIGDKVLELPLIVGTEQEVGIDIAVLRDKTGAVTFDPGYGNTGACKSAVTFLDGELGILRYRGYDIAALANGASFLEVAWLLLLGELPTQAQLTAFEAAEKAQRAVPAEVKALIQGLPKSTHPMAALSAAVLALSGYEGGGQAGGQGIGGIDGAMVKLLAQFPTVAAWIFRSHQGLPLVEPDANLGYSANFLRMMFEGTPRAKMMDDAVAHALDLLFILHADHEQNCSTSTVRLVGSSQANLHASIAGGICALWGPLHGGANQAVIEMLDEVQAAGGDVSKAVLQAKDKNSGFRLMGFGHRVYKNFDPRAKIIKVQCDIVLGKLGVQDPLLRIARGMEEAALQDDYFIQRKLYPNVDFYSGIIYRALGFPSEMFTVLFALGRLPGWMAHFREMNLEKARIGRPRQIYAGATERQLVPLAQR
jgi:citrate synthase